MHETRGGIYFPIAEHNKSIKDNNNRRLQSPVTVKEVTTRLYLNIIEALQARKHVHTRWMALLERGRVISRKKCGEDTVDMMSPGEYFAERKAECEKEAKKRVLGAEKENDRINEKLGKDFKFHKAKHVKEWKEENRRIAAANRLEERRIKKEENRERGEEKRGRARTARTYKPAIVRGADIVEGELKEAERKMRETKAEADKVKDEKDTFNKEDERMDIEGFDNRDQEAVERFETNLENLDKSTKRLRALTRQLAEREQAVDKLRRELSNRVTPRTINDVDFHTQLSNERKREMRGRYRGARNSEQREAIREELANEDRLQEGFSASLEKEKDESRGKIEKLIMDRADILEDWMAALDGDRDLDDKDKNDAIFEASDRLDHSADEIGERWVYYFSLLRKRELKDRVPNIKERLQLTEEALTRVGTAREKDERKKVLSEARALDEAIKGVRKQRPRTEKEVESLKERQANRNENGTTPQTWAARRSREEQESFDRRSANRNPTTGVIQRTSRAKKG